MPSHSDDPLSGVPRQRGIPAESSLREQDRSEVRLHVPREYQKKLLLEELPFDIR